MYFENKLTTAQHLLEREEFLSAIREISSIFEEGLKKILGRLEKSITTLSEKKHFSDLEKKIGQTRSCNTFHLSQLTRFLEDEIIWSIARRETTSNLRMSKHIKWNCIAQWRNDATHNAQRIEWEEIQATQMLIWAKLFLYEFELLDDTPHIKRPKKKEASNDCPQQHCGQRLHSKWKFCPRCGSGRTIQCRNCGHSLEVDFKICPHCEMRTPVGGNGPCNEAEIKYSLLCRGAWLDGVMNTREKQILEDFRVKNGIDLPSADRIQRECAPPENLSYHNYVESAHIDHVITPEERRFLDAKAKELGIDDWTKKEIEASFREQLSSTVETTTELTVEIADE